MSSPFMFSFSFDSDSDSDSSSGGKGFNVRTASLICAIAAPIVNSIVNTLDKVIVADRVHHTGSYIGVIGFLDVLIG